MFRSFFGGRSQGNSRDGAVTNPKGKEDAGPSRVRFMSTSLPPRYPNGTLTYSHALLIHLPRITTFFAGEVGNPLPKGGSLLVSSTSGCGKESCIAVYLYAKAVKRLYRKSAGLFLALYLKHYASSLQIAYGGEEVIGDLTIAYQFRKGGPSRQPGGGNAAPVGVEEEGSTRNEFTKGDRPTNKELAKHGIEGCGLNLLSGVAELVRSVSPLVRSAGPLDLSRRESYAHSLSRSKYGIELVPCRPDPLMKEAIPAVKALRRLGQISPTLPNALSKGPSSTQPQVSSPETTGEPGLVLDLCPVSGPVFVIGRVGTGWTYYI
ncbi:unnamed protein product [Lupinus luteus]|uniref:Uncharacterized protein n=1 Tax=Lupinus luteus TaxID=3873 RepID=A0AAV1WB50_LUPLU